LGGCLFVERAGCAASFVLQPAAAKKKKKFQVQS
jgi:hypothetical protein